MPHGVLDVLRIHGLVQLKLFGAALEFARIIKRDAALPVIRLARGLHLNHLVEFRHRFLETPGAEKVFAAALMLANGNRRWWRWRADRHGYELLDQRAALAIEQPHHSIRARRCDRRAVGLPRHREHSAVVTAQNELRIGRWGRLSHRLCRAAVSGVIY